MGQLYRKEGLKWINIDLNIFSFHEYLEIEIKSKIIYDLVAKL